MMKFVSNLSWGYIVAMKGAKFVLVVPLGVLGAIAILTSLDYSLFSWVLMVLLALYVAAETFDAMVDFNAHWQSRNQKKPSA